MRRTKQRLALAAAVLGLNLAGAVAAAAQQAGTVLGQVTDAATSRPVASAQVFVVGTQRGALTNADGRYVIPQVPVGARTVKVTVLGYAEGTRAVTVSAGVSVTANFTLSQSAVELNAVVVSALTGRSERKKEIGANVTNITVADVNKGPVTSMADVLNGRTAGVDLREVNGGVGTSQKIRIRGANSLNLSNEPLIYVDGVLFNNSTGISLGTGGQDVSRLNDLSPEDIANIEVLKGPAASSMYGSAAANGVMIITTKRGRAGKVAWHGYVETGSVQDKNTYPDTYVAYSVTDGTKPLIDPSQNWWDLAARPTCYTYQAAAGSCKQDSVIVGNIFKTPLSPFTTGFNRTAGLSVSGGSDAVTYYLSGDVQDQRGVIFFNTDQRKSFRSNVDTHLRPDLDLSVSAGYTAGNLSLSSNDNSVFGPMINAQMGPAVMYPEIPGEASSNYGFYYTPDQLQYFATHQDVNRFMLGSSAHYRPLSWLTASANVGMDLTDRHDFRTVQPNKLIYTDETYTVGQRASSRASTGIYTATASAASTFQLRPDLSSTTTVGGSYEKNHFQSTYGYGVGIVAGTGTLGGTSSQFAVDEGFSETITVGGYAQEKLGWRERLFVTGGLRGDDNSAFGTKLGWAWYPSATVSYLISEEPFFPKLPGVSNLRLRAGWGTAGLRPNFRDAETYYTPVAVTTNGKERPAAVIGGLGRDTLKPERTREYEFGGDLGLFKERLSLDFTYYHKRSQDALISVPLPNSLGSAANRLQNIGSILNSGTEIGLKALAINHPNLKLNLQIAATTLNNKITKLGDIPPIQLNRGFQLHKEGFFAGGYFSKLYKWADANGDGKLCISSTPTQTCPAPEVTLASDTVVFIGPSLPTFTRAFSGDLTLLRYITISTLFDWRGGNRTMNYTEYFRCSQLPAFGERGCKENMDPHATLAEQARYLAARYLGAYAGYMEDAGFVKWRELSITANAPDFLVQHLSLARGASVTVSGRNLHTWTNYTGPDPEVSETGGGANFTQGELATEPPVRFYTVRLNFTF